MQTRNKLYALLICIGLFLPCFLTAQNPASADDSLIVIGRESIELGRYDHAKNILLDALKLARQSQKYENVLMINSLLAESYEHKKDFRTANIFLRKNQAMLDSISYLNIAENRNQSKHAELLSEHKQFISQLQDENKEQKTSFCIIIFVILLVSAVVIVTITLHSKKRMRIVLDEKTKNLKETNILLQKEIMEKNESEKKFRTIFEHAPVMINAFDNEGKCLLWNKECEKQLGWSIEELQTSPDPLLRIYPDRKDRDEVLKHIRNADGTFNEDVATAKDGSTKYQMWSNYRLSENFYLSVGYDITDRKRSENELAQSRDRYEKLVNNSPSLIAEIDASTLKILSCNPAMAKSLGSDVESIIGKDIRDLIPNDIFQSRIKSARKALKGNKSISFEDSNHGRYFYNTIIPIITKEQKIYQMVSYDITDRKLAEFELKRREALLASLIYNIPLNFIVCLS